MVSTGLFTVCSDGSAEVGRQSDADIDGLCVGDSVVSRGIVRLLTSRGSVTCVFGI